MENSKNTASLVSFVSPLMAAREGTSRILMNKATGDAPLFITMRMIQYLGSQYFPPTSKLGVKFKIAIYECPKCGKLFKTRINSVKCGKTKGCGCGKYKHKMSNTLIFGQWKNILSRITNPNIEGYKNYGGRGIIIYFPWMTDFKLYYDYVKNLPHFGEKGYTIDRIDNDGNYEPGNLRWATRHIQSTNQRTLKKNNNTGFAGVYFNSKKRKPWEAIIGVNKKQIYIGAFSTPREAAVARNNYIIANNLKEYKLNKIN